LSSGQRQRLAIRSGLDRLCAPFALLLPQPEPRQLNQLLVSSFWLKQILDSPKVSYLFVSYLAPFVFLRALCAFAVKILVAIWQRKHRGVYLLQHASNHE
jgi:hypothetical protein